MFFVATWLDPNESNDFSYLYVPFEVLNRCFINTPAVNKTLYTYDFTINLNATLLTGRQTASAQISSLLSTDRIVEVQPIADLPGNLSIAYAYIPTNGAIRVAFSPPIVFTGNNNIDMRLSVLR